MNLDQQIQDLIDEAPQDGTTPTAMGAIAPVLSQIASRLKHSQYYIWQLLDQSWVITTLRNQAKPELEKTVVYAYADLKDATTTNPSQFQDSQLVARPLPVIQLLFRTVSVTALDSLIFFDNPGNLARGTEIRRQEVQDLIANQLQQALLNPQLPPDIA